MRKDSIIKVFNTCDEYFNILRHQRKYSALAEPEVLELIQQNLKGNILDAGCGEGSLCVWLAKKNLSANIYGVDISKIGVGMAKLAAIELKNINFKAANLKNLPFEDDFFDLIISQSVLEHVVGYSEALKEFKRVLKSKGKLIIRVSNGGRCSKKLFPSFFNYLFHRNKVVKLNPSLKLGENKLYDHRHNFDVNSIPSDVLLKQLRNLSFKIKYFTTRREGIFIKQQYKKFNIIKRLLIYAYVKVPFYPFIHLGPTIILVGEKQ